MDTIGRIIKGCTRNESRYQRAFYDRYRLFASKVVFRYVYRYSKVVDLVTDGFVKAFKHIGNLEVPEEPYAEQAVMAWLKKIMINTSIDELRRNSMLPEIGSIDELAWEVPDKQDEADRLLLYADLVMLIKELPPNYRLVFNLHVIDGYSHVEIAEQLNIPVGTSRSNLSRAKILLQDKIKQMEAVHYAGSGT